MTVRLRLILLALTTSLGIAAVAAIGLYGIDTSRGALEGDRQRAQKFEELSKASAAFGAACESYHAAIAVLVNGEATDDLRRAMSDRLQEFQGYESVRGLSAGGADIGSLTRQFREGAAFIEKGDSMEAAAYFSKNLAKPVADFKRALADRFEQERQAMDKEGKKAIESAQSLSRTAIPVALLSFLLAVGFAVSAQRRIGTALPPLLEAANQLSDGETVEGGLITGNDELAELGRAFERIADSVATRVDFARAITSGDLSRDLKLASARDQLGIALREMQVNLRDIVEVNRISLGVSAGANNIAEASSALSEQASKQAASIEEITATMTEIGAQSQKNAESASQASTIAGQTQASSEKGNREVGEMVAAMSQMQASSQQVAKVVKLIDDIAFQTNLLALNASVEAARAGKAGKGFAVVASEVRNLAGRSATAARETAELIEQTVRQTEAGAQVVRRTEATLKEISQSVVKMVDIMGEIAAASREQASAVAQASTGLHQIEQVTLFNTANAEKTSGAAQELNEQAAELRALMGRFRIDRSNGASEVEEPSGTTALALRS